MNQRKMLPCRETIGPDRFFDKFFHYVTAENVNSVIWREKLAIVIVAAVYVNSVLQVLEMHADYWSNQGRTLNWVIKTDWPRYTALVCVFYPEKIPISNSSSLLFVSNNGNFVASRGHLDCLKILIEDCGAWVDVNDKHDCTPMMYAATLGFIDCIRYLNARGADKNHQDRKGRR